MGRGRERRRSMPKKIPRVLEIENDGKDLFVIIDGLKIAKRGHPGTRHAGTWISLEPGWTVQEDHSKIAVEYQGAPIH
jgi:hypothetical protein